MRYYANYLETYNKDPVLWDPTPQEFHHRCPHLSKLQVFNLMGERNIFALPPMKVKGTVQIGVYQPADHIAKTRGILMIPGYAQQRSQLMHVSYAQQASQYAKEHWSSKLVDLDEHELHEVHLLRKTKPSLVITYALSVPWSRLRRFSGETLRSKLDKATTIAALDPNIAAEIRCKGPVLQHFNCGNCGGGVGQTTCSQCGMFYDLRPTHPSKNPQLQETIVTLLRENGHRFKIRP